MQTFKDRVAVVTGAGSGIGRALAERFASEGMKLVLADVEAEPLARVEAELRGQGAEVIAVPTDVSQAADVETLAEGRSKRLAPSTSSATTRALGSARPPGSTPSRTGSGCLG